MASRAERNNNPGNLVASSWTQNQPGYVGADGRFAVFANPQAGQAAQQALLNNYLSGGRNTVSAIIDRYAPASDNNPVNNYASYVASRVGVSPTDTLSASQIPALARAMSEFESGNRGSGVIGAAPDALGYAGTSTPSNAATAAINKAAPATRVMVAPAKPSSLPFGLGNIMSAAKNGLAAVQGIAADPAVRAGVQRGVMSSPGLMAQVMASPALRNQAFNALMAKNIGAAPTVQQGWNNNPNGTLAYAVSNAGQRPVTLVQSAGQVRSDAQMPNPGNQNMAVYRANREAVGGPITQQSIDQALNRNAVLYALAGGGGGGYGGGNSMSSLTQN